MLPKKILILVAFFHLGTLYSVYAQKLPNIQQNSLRAPVDINIDGKGFEWGNSFQAYNHATDVFYSIANDDENLYLVVQSNDINVLFKIFGNGITWSVRQRDSKEGKNQVNITYPILPHTPYLHLSRKKSETEDTTAKATDLWIQRNNKLLNDSCKFIRVSGIPGIDTLVSVYNRDGIKTKGQFNTKKAYTCEFSIELKLLNVSVNDNPKLTYGIRINGMKPIISIVMPTNPSPEEAARLDRANQFINKELAPTYFWGEYTLAKKQ
jgi:hypothetical protein